ncbi:hypothetical protein ACFU6S_10075 [Streptomyces sp. NPDC057456]|uniref:hypothetical protein n=1 Tax=Streptomyces sp. NPDC057456 TaxID=3346139 RepID=UPI00367B0CE6
MGRPRGLDPSEPPQPLTAGNVEVRLVASTPEAARQVAEVLRRHFASSEQRSYPGTEAGGTRLHLTVDTARAAGPARSWLATSQSSGSGRTQTDEI